MWALVVNNRSFILWVVETAMCLQLLKIFLNIFSLLPENLGHAHICQLQIPLLLLLILFVFFQSHLTQYPIFLLHLLENERSYFVFLPYSNYNIFIVRIS